MRTSNDFEKWSQFWISTTSQYSHLYLTNYQPTEEFVTPDKKRIANIVFNNLNHICISFLDIVVGKAESSFSEGVSRGVCINRLLGKNSLHLLPPKDSQTISQLLQETFYLGVFTHLYIWTFPTREQGEKVNISQLQQKWEIDAITADAVMGYYGDRKRPECMGIWEYHFKTSVINTLKNHFKIGSFKMGKFKSFFRNLYIAGALLVMDYDLATKKQ